MKYSLKQAKSVTTFSRRHLEKRVNSDENLYNKKLAYNYKDMKYCKNKPKFFIKTLWLIDAKSLNLEGENLLLSHYSQKSC